MWTKQLTFLKSILDLSLLLGHSEIVEPQYKLERIKNMNEQALREKVVNYMKKMAEIMKNSGYNTEAVNWVLENY